MSKFIVACFVVLSCLGAHEAKAQLAPGKVFAKERVIALDPGHVGFSTGAFVGIKEGGRWICYSESKFVNDVTLRVQEGLKLVGVKVMMTARGQTYKKPTANISGIPCPGGPGKPKRMTERERQALAADLDRRIGVANSIYTEHPDAPFLSLHMNAPRDNTGNNLNVKGALVIVPPGDTASILAQSLIAPFRAEGLAKKERGAEVPALVENGNCREIEVCTVRVLRSDLNFVRHKALLELLYLTHPSDRESILTAAGRQKIADRVVRGVPHYFETLELAASNNEAKR